LISILSGEADMGYNGARLAEFFLPVSAEPDKIDIKGQ
jgi:hypothetical protein